MYCPNCGTKVQEDWDFCPQCGARQDDASQETTKDFMPGASQDAPAPQVTGLASWYDSTATRTFTKTTTERQLWTIGHLFSKIGLVGIIIGPAGFLLTLLIDLVVNGEMDWEISLPFFLLAGMFLLLGCMTYIPGLLLQGFSDLLGNTRRTNEILLSQKDQET